MVFAACRTGSVHVAFRPAPHARYRYAVDVHADTTTAVQGRPTNHRITDEHFKADHTVLSADRGGVLVAVRLQAPGVPERSFQVRFDRAASLAAVQQVESIPASVLGDLGLSEVFPAAAGAPPARALRPGASWPIDQAVRLPGTADTRLTGRGRLDRLGVIGGRQIATVKSEYSFPVHQVSQDVVIDGTEETSVDTSQALKDGAVQFVHATTTGHF